MSQPLTNTLLACSERSLTFSAGDPQRVAVFRFCVASILIVWVVSNGGLQIVWGSAARERHRPKPPSVSKDSFEVVAKRSSLTMSSLVRLNECTVLGYRLDLFLQEVTHEDDSCQALDGHDAGANDGGAAWRLGIRPGALAPEPADGTRGQHNEGDDGAERSVSQKENEEFLVGQANAVVNPGAMMVHTKDAAVAGLAVVSSRRLPPTLAERANFGVLEVCRCNLVADGSGIGGHCLKVGKPREAEQTLIQCEQEQARVSERQPQPWYARLGCGEPSR